MGILSIDAAAELKKVFDRLHLQYRNDNNVITDVAVFANGDRTTSKLKDVFIEIEANGSPKTESSQYGLITQSVLVAIYVEVLPNGAFNRKREAYILDLIDSTLEAGVSSGKYFFKIDKTALFGEAKSIVTGYSTKLINLNVIIKN